MPVWLIVLLSCLVVTLVLGYILANKFIWNIEKWNYDKKECTEMFLTGTFVIFLASTLVAPLFIGMAEETYDYVQYENIYSIRSTDDEIDGSFFLGSGYIDEKTYYVVFVEDEKGIKLNKYNTINTYIVEVDNGNYYVRCVKEKWSMSDYYILYVPVGTIIVEYRI